MDSLSRYDGLCYSQVFEYQSKDGIWCIIVLVSRDFQWQKATWAITIFLTREWAAGVPGTLAALSLAYVSNLFGSITHYSSGQAAVYYGAGFLGLKDIFSMGFLTTVVNLLIWGGVGSVWWKIIGLYWVSSHCTSEIYLSTWKIIWILSSLTNGNLSCICHSA